MNPIYMPFMKEPNLRLPRKLKKRIKKRIEERQLNKRYMENIQGLDQLYTEWQSLQPLKPEYQKRLDDKFKLEFNYNSNHIEGNTLTYGQTKLLFMFGETSGNASLKDYEEMQAHNVGLEMMKVVARDKERPLTESFLRELNQTILVQDYWKTGITPNGTPTRMQIKVGTYKTRPNSVLTVTGEEFNYATPEETPAFMTSLVEWFNQEEAKGELSPIELASLLHYRYIRIHPFEDGNGRIARLLVNYVLYRHGYPMLVVHTADKDNYLRILHECDINVGLTPSDGANATIEQIEPFVKYMKEQLKRALVIGINAAKGESIEDDDDFAKRLTLLQRKLAAKNEDPDAYSIRQFWNIMDVFYFPLTESIRTKVKAVLNLFGQTSYSNLLSKSSDKNEGISLTKEMRTSKNSDVYDYIKNAKSVSFCYSLMRPKDINMNPSIITVKMTIRFFEKSYGIEWLNNKEYSYGSFPSEEDSKQIIGIFQNTLMQRIEEALK
jgi:Fic family protein